MARVAEWGKQHSKDLVDFLVCRGLETEDRPIRFVPPADKVDVGADATMLHLSEVEVIEPDLLVCEDRREVDLDSRGRVEKVSGILSGESRAVTHPQDAGWNRSSPRLMHLTIGDLGVFKDGVSELTPDDPCRERG